MRIDVRTAESRRRWLSRCLAAGGVADCRAFVSAVNQALGRRLEATAVQAR